MRILTIIIIIISAASPLNGLSADDQAYLKSKNYRAEARTAYQDGEREKALELMIAADKAQPNNPAIIGNILFLSIELQNSDLAFEAAQRYVALHLSPPTQFLQPLCALIPEEKADMLRAAFEEISKPVGTGVIAAEVPEVARLIEGVAFNADKNTFYVSSVISKAIYKITPDGNIEALIDVDDHQYGSFFGIALDPSNRFLYATFASIDHTPNMGDKQRKTGLLKFDIQSGNIVQTWFLANATGAQIADLTITRAGQIYLSDAVGKAVYQVHDDTLVKRFEHSGFVNPQGIVETKNGNLILADYGRGLWHLDTKTNAVTLIKTPPNLSLIGFDGLKASSTVLYGIQNGITPHRVLKLGLSIDEREVVSHTIIAKNLDTFDEPTLLDIKGDSLYIIANSQWPKYAKGGALKDNKEQKPTKILQIKVQ
jgi:hypothetical protein